MQPEPLQPLTIAQAAAAYALLCTLVGNIERLPIPPCLMHEIVRVFVETMQSAPDARHGETVTSMVQVSEESSTERTLEGTLIGLLLLYSQQRKDSGRAKRASNNPKDYDLGDLNKLMNQGETNE